MKLIFLFFSHIILQIHSHNNDLDRQNAMDFIVAHLTNDETMIGMMSRGRVGFDCVGITRFIETFRKTFRIRGNPHEKSLFLEKYVENQKYPTSEYFQKNILLVRETFTSMELLDSRIKTLMEMISFNPENINWENDYILWLHDNKCPIDFQTAENKSIFSMTFKEYISMEWEYEDVHPTRTSSSENTKKFRNALIHNNVLTWNFLVDSKVPFHWYQTNQAIKFLLFFSYISGFPESLETEKICKFLKTFLNLVWKQRTNNGIQLNRISKNIMILRTFLDSYFKLSTLERKTYTKPLKVFSKSININFALESGEREKVEWLFDMGSPVTRRKIRQNV